jgi:hypothetical protein
LLFTASPRQRQWGKRGSAAGMRQPQRFAIQRRWNKLGSAIRS